MSASDVDMFDVTVCRSFDTDSISLFSDWLLRYFYCPSSELDSSAERQMTETIVL